MALVQSPPVFAELIEFLASTPSHEAILAYKPSDELQARLSYLLDKNRHESLSSEENAELDEIMRIGHFVNMLKISVRKKMAGK